MQIKQATYKIETLDEVAQVVERVSAEVKDWGGDWKVSEPVVTELPTEIGYHVTIDVKEADKITCKGFQISEDENLEKRIEEIVTEATKDGLHPLKKTLREEEYPNGYVLHLELGGEGVEPLEEFVGSSKVDKAYDSMCKENARLRTSV